MPFVDEVEQGDRERHTGKETHERSPQNFRIMAYTVITIVAGIIAGIAVGFLVAGYQQGNRTLMIYSALGIWIFTGVSVATTLLKDAPLGSATVVTEQIQRKAIAAQQRSFVQVDGFALAIGTDLTQVFFRLTADGPTQIDIESGEISISIDDPPLSAEDRRKGLYTAQIKPQRITPRQQAVQSVQVAALPAVHQQRLLKGPPTEIFYVGEIRYWDAFRETGTPRHLRQFAYSITDHQIRSLDSVIWARNNETDEQ